MPKTLSLSSPVYEIPFDDNTLLVVGRIALLWGQIIFHLDAVLALLMKMSVPEAAKYETKSVKTKLTDLSRELSKSENAKHRKKLSLVHHAVDQLASDRNIVFHGLWGRWLERDRKTWRSAAKSYCRDEPFYADKLKELHERMVGASEALDDAWYALGLGDGPQPSNRNRLQLWVPKGTKRPFADPPLRLLR